MRVRRFLAAVVAALMAASAGCSHSEGPAQTRIMLVGDSLTQGSSGDWTWRYRLWIHLRDAGANVDFVGPRDDLQDNATGDLGSHEYPDPNFDQDHAARWGMAFADETPSIGELVDTYHPDVVVEGFGINDLVGFGESPSQLLQSARRFVEDARAADPGVDVVLMALPQLWLTGVGDYNAGLPALAAELSTDDSRVVVARADQPFVEDVDTYDPAHPSATGEVKIAAGVADALAGLGIGTAYPRPLPAVPLGPREPPVLEGRAGEAPDSVDLSWEFPPGATAVFVWVRDTTTGEEWQRLPIPQPGRSFTARGLVEGNTYEFRVQAEKGTAVAEDVFSNVVTVTPAR